jgi:hypothetical protein
MPVLHHRQMFHNGSVLSMEYLAFRSKLKLLKHRPYRSGTIASLSRLRADQPALVVDVFVIDMERVVPNGDFGLLTMRSAGSRY